MGKAELAKIVAHCDEILRTKEVQDYDRAANGLQVQNTGEIRSIAAAVDASLATVRKAIAAKAGLLIVHHGLFWGPSHPWTGKRYELLRLLFENDLAVYSSHLPLDIHPTLGNNHVLASALRLKPLKPFFYDAKRKFHMGFAGRATLDRDLLLRRVEEATGAPGKLIPGGPRVCKRIGVVTGGAGAELHVAAAEGVDTFITGEGPHWTYALAEELGINVIYGGHYATETFGVKALSGHLSKRFGLPWTFIDHPTGL